MTEQPAFDFDGDTYVPEHDQLRLNEQTRLVAAAMADGKWRTLAEIEKLTRAPQASVSARLRDLRKQRFGLSDVERRRRGEETRGLHEYRLTLSDRARRALQTQERDAR